MTKKDFELIANELREARGVTNDTGNYNDPDTLDDLIAGFAVRLSTTSPRFARERFLRAAGYQL